MQTITLLRTRFDPLSGACKANIELSLKERSNDMYEIRTTAEIRTVPRSCANENHRTTCTGGTGDPEYTFLALGGFAYFRLQGETLETLQTNALVKSDNGLIFRGPHRWRSEYTENLQREERFQDVTIGELLELGVKKYCFINPNERLKSSAPNGVDWRPVRDGGFVYLYDEHLRPHQFDRFFALGRSTGIEPAQHAHPTVFLGSKSAEHEQRRNRSTYVFALPRSTDSMSVSAVQAHVCVSSVL